jgi:16S rRNA (guanine527-N7)-methyltransferase
MLPVRIAALLEPFLGPQDQSPKTENLIRDISMYIDILIRWNARINLTAIRDPEEIVTRHFGESLFAASRLFPNGAVTDPAAERQKNAAHSASRGEAAKHIDPAPKGRKKPPSVADLGSGAGFPGLPIKLWAPQIHLTLIESNHKKATFLKEITRALTLTDVNIQTTRAESLTEEKFDVVTLRAVESFTSILPTAASLLTPQGRLALLIGSAQLIQAKSAQPDLNWSTPTPIPQSHSRILVLADKI